MKNRLPNFVIVGAPKCGTTSLHRYLQQHEQVFVPAQKELHYFTRELLARNSAGPGDAHAVGSACGTREEYEAHYAGSEGFVAVGDVSPSYLYFHEVAKDMRATLGDARIVIALRDPVAKAFSHYMHLVRDGRETLGFEEGLAEEERRTEENWAVLWRYVGASLYSESVRRYIEVFGAERVHVIFQEELRAEAPRVLRGLFSFLGVDPDVELDTTREHHRSGRPKSRLVANLVARSGWASKTARAVLPDALRHRLRGVLQDMNTGEKDELSEETARGLRARFESDTDELESLLGRAMPWRRGEGL